MSDGTDRSDLCFARRGHGFAEQRGDIYRTICELSSISSVVLSLGFVPPQMMLIIPKLHQILAPIMSVLLTVPLGPQPSGAAYGGQPSAFELRVNGASILNKIATMFASKYPGLIPRELLCVFMHKAFANSSTGISATLLNTFHLPPYPSPLGVGNPPIGRYEGCILGIGALGSRTIRQCLFDDPSVLQRIDNYCGTLYSGAESKRLGKQSLARATIEALRTMVGAKPDNWKGSVSWDKVAQEFGPNLARAMEKQPWLTSELLRMRRDGEQNGHGDMAVDT